AEVLAEHRIIPRTPRSRKLLDNDPGAPHLRSRTLQGRSSASNPPGGMFRGSSPRRGAGSSSGDAMNGDLIVLVVITFAAAVVNGALGHGFSSLTVPFALFFYTNRALNPALVLTEVVINGSLLYMSRSSLPAIWRRLIPIVLGLVPGIVVGASLLPRVNAEWLKLFVYLVLLPLILCQAAGVRRPVRLTASLSLPFGVGL